jgi:hypothetical protein
MSDATIRSYRDTWRLFLRFLAQARHVPAYQLAITDVDVDSASIHRWAFGCQRDVVCALRFVWGRG